MGTISNGTLWMLLALVVDYDWPLNLIFSLCLTKIEAFSDLKIKPNVWMYPTFNWSDE